MKALFYLPFILLSIFPGLYSSISGQSSYYREESSYVIHGDNLANVGNIEEAIRHYSAAIAINPYFVKAYVRRADLYQKSGRSTLAVQDYRHALSLNPFALDLYRLGVDASRINILAIESDTTDENLPNPAAENLYQTAVSRLLSREVFAATQAIEEAIRLSARDSRFYKLLGNIYILNGDYKKAIDQYNKALQLQPDYPEAIYNRGIAYILASNMEKGCNDLQISIDKGLHLGVDKMKFICPQY